MAKTCLLLKLKSSSIKRNTKKPILWLITIFLPFENNLAITGTNFHSQSAICNSCSSENGHDCDCAPLQAIPSEWEDVQQAIKIREGCCWLYGRSSHRRCYGRSKSKLNGNIYCLIPHCFSTIKTMRKANLRRAPWWSIAAPKWSNPLQYWNNLHWLFGVLLQQCAHQTKQNYQ